MANQKIIILFKKIFNLYFFIFLTFVKYGYTQTDSTSITLPEAVEESIEYFIQDIEGDADFDFNGLVDELNDLRRNPLNLNKASFEELNFGLLSPLQIQNFLNYRNQAGDLASIYELQSVPDFSIPLIKTMLPFVAVNPKSIYQTNSLRQILKKSNSQLLTRWTRFAEPQIGYDPERTGNRYLGDPNQFAVRFRINAQNKVGLVLTAEKDRGEEFFKGSNPNGFDFYSGNLFLRDLNPFVKQIILGDFTSGFGQGLILQVGFVRGKNAQVQGIKRRNQPIRSYSSSHESAFFRGVGAELAIGKDWQMTVFGSRRRLDGTVLATDTTETDEDFLFTSVIENGNHRTQSEIEKERQIGMQTAAARLETQKRNFNFALNSVFGRLSNSFQPNGATFNRFQFQGNEYWNLSADYTYYKDNYHFFGETAVDPNFNIATLNGLFVGLGKYATLSFLHRNYPKEFIALHGQGFSEGRITKNEKGLYTGLSIKPTRQLTIDSYFDFWKFDWLRFNQDAPADGHEWLTKIIYRPSKKLEAYAQWRGEVRSRNQVLNSTKVDFLIPNLREYYRFQIRYKFADNLEWRNRFEYSLINKGEESGFLMYQDLIWKLPDHGWLFKLRAAYYAIDDFASRIYTYENDLLYSFSVPSFYGRGSRFYLYSRYKFNKKLSVEMRVGQTFRESEEGIGSGLELIEGKTRTDLRAQAIWKF